MIKEPYIISEHAEKILMDEDLVGLTKEKLKAGSTEIYAKYGQKFKDRKIQIFLLDRE